MKYHAIKLIAGFFLLMAALPNVASGARLVSLLTCKEVIEPNTIPNGVTDQFTSETPMINAVAIFTDVPKGTQLKGTWVAIDAIATPNYTIASTNVKVTESGEAKAKFSISKPDQGWPTGNYRFELYLESNLISAAKFSISTNTQATFPAGNSQAAFPANTSNNSAMSNQGYGQAQNTASSLLGCWQCQSAAGASALTFHSQNFLEHAGEQANYMLLPGVIRVFAGYQTLDCRYQLTGNQLGVVYPDGSQMQCFRSDCASMRTAGSAQQYPQQSGNYSSYNNNSGFVPPSYDSGSWETESDRQFYDDSAGYGGGAYDNPNSNYYDYSNDSYYDYSSDY